jgi:hypothetical protein
LEIRAFRTKGEEAPWRSLQAQLEEGTAAIPWSQGKGFLFTIITNPTPDSLDVLDLPQNQAIKMSFAH